MLKWKRSLSTVFSKYQQISRTQQKGWYQTSDPALDSPLWGKCLWDDSKFPSLLSADIARLCVNRNQSLVCVCLEVPHFFWLCAASSWPCFLFSARLYVTPCWLFLQWPLSSKQRSKIQLGPFPTSVGFTSVPWKFVLHSERMDLDL